MDRTDPQIAPNNNTAVNTAVNTGTAVTESEW